MLKIESSVNTQSIAVHNALLEVGFVYDQRARLYMLHESCGDVLIQKDHTESFDKVLKRLGSFLFMTSLRTSNPPMIPLIFGKTQEIMGHAAIWTDLQVCKAALNFGN